MFFRRERPKSAGFAQQVDTLKSRGFTTVPMAGGVVRVTRGSCAADLREKDGVAAVEGRAGILVGTGIASLVDVGFQKFFRTPEGARKPALAEELVALHNFEEDLRDALGQTVLYNEALGTVSAFYQYDRVKDRDRGVPKRVWE